MTTKQSVYDFSVKNIQDQMVSLKDHQNKVLLIVNTASRCGFTPQLKGLENLYKKYQNQGFSILAFPCNQFFKQEPLNNQNIQSFCETNYGVTFPIFAKINVNGSDTSPLFAFLKKQKGGLLGGKIKWNFTKFLIDQKGQVIRRFAPATKPETIAPYIESLF